jgi:hypothetical protein
MSKVLRISQGGYKIITEPGSELKLDVGEAGQVRITGDLIVEGARTDLEVSVLNVEDRDIVINKANTTAAANYPGIVPINNGTRASAGLLIQRGSLPQAEFLYDENPLLNYFPPGANDLNQGAFIFKDATGKLLGITTNFIQTGGSSLHFNTGIGGKIQVKTSGAIPYSNRIGQDDDIPNIKYIKEYVRAEAGQAIIEKFSRYYEDEDGNFFDTRTGADARDIIAGDITTGVFFTVALGAPGPNGSLGLNREVFQVGNFNRKGVFVGDATASGATKPHLKLYVNEPPLGNTIDTKYSYIETDNGPLVINPSDGLVKLKRKLEVEHLQPSELDPDPVPNTNTIWSRGDQGAGGTGIYFANTLTQGEVCSAAKALVYGLIF